MCRAVNGCITYCRSCELQLNDRERAMNQSEDQLSALLCSRVRAAEQKLLAYYNRDIDA